MVFELFFNCETVQPKNMKQQKTRKGVDQRRRDQNQMARTVCMGYSTQYGGGKNMSLRTGPEGLLSNCPRRRALKSSDNWKGMILHCSQRVEKSFVAGTDAELRREQADVKRMEHNRTDLCSQEYR